MKLTLIIDEADGDKKQLLDILSEFRKRLNKELKKPTNYDEELGLISNVKIEDCYCIGDYEAKLEI